MQYYELWNVLCNWRSEFAVGEFSSTFPSPSPGKVIHDMLRKGFLERIGRGRYRVNRPEEYLAKKVNIAHGYELPKEAGMTYSFTDVDAVYLWTKGGYQVERFLGFYPIHISVREEDLDSWKEFFKARNMTVHVAGERVEKTLFGLFYVLHPRAEVEIEDVGGQPVDPLSETLEFCRERIYSYEPALEMLDEMYDLGIGAAYREEGTYS